MACNERGMALVSVVLTLTLLLTLAHILTEKVWQSTRQNADAANREQLFWAAQGGIESARQQLAANYSSSGGWQNYLRIATLQAYPLVPAWVSEINGLPVEIYYLLRNTTGVSLWMEVPAAIYASGQAKLGP